ncbi:MAG: ferrous iron transport protein A, partial [Deltaproteobacteria bacterium]|nr:ferrous iron transport protein A [Deltaproteobacteria bacterium]
MLLCPLCQRSFDEQTACHGCGLNKQCQLIRCPHCYYEFVEKSSAIDFLDRIGRLFRKEKSPIPKHPDPLVICLLDATPGERYQIVFIRPRKETRMNHLVGFGVIPGSTISLRQKRPAYLIQADETEIALDEAVAGEI